MTKDRLQELRNSMQQYAENQDTSENAEKENQTPLITFFDHARSVKLEIQGLKYKVNNLKTLLEDNKHWKDSKASNRKEMEMKIEQEKLVIGTSAREIRNNLKAMKNSSWGSKGTSVVQRIKDVQLNTIINDLNEVLREYLNCLVQHRERSVKVLKDMIEVKGDKISDIEALLEEGKIAIFTNNILIGDMEEKYSLREAEDKHKEIMKIESSILEIRNLFNELALIVDLQGEKIDEVEELVDENLIKVEKGKTKLNSASKKKRKLRYRKLLITGICVGIIVIVLFLLTVV